MENPPAAPIVPSIQNRRQLEAAVENILQLQLRRTELFAAHDREIAAVREKYRPLLDEVERYLLLETAWVETWARNNPAALDHRRSLACAGATIGFRAPALRVERASRRWTWTAIVLKLGETAWGRRYLRVPAPEVNKDAILADRAKFTPDELRQLGLKIVDQDRFYVTPHGAGAEESAPHERPDWQEAA